MPETPRLAPKLARRGGKASLRHLLQRLEALERDWPDAGRRERALAAARELAGGIESAGFTLPPGSRDLAGRLAGRIELHELVSLIVPLERALDRRARDEDFLPVTDRARAPAATMPVCVVADSLRSAFNVGGVFRTGECFGIDEIVLSGYSAGPDEARVARAAMGTDRLVAWSRERAARDAVEALRARGRFVIALETGEDNPTLAELEVRFPCAILLGNERFGLAPGVVADADARARIPTYGAKASLNVVAALAIALHELRRRFDASASSDAATPARGRPRVSSRRASSSRRPRAPRR